MFSFQHPVQIHFGQGIFSELNDILSYNDYSSYIIVMSNSQIDNGLDRLVKSQLGDKVKDVVTDIEQNPTLDNVQRIVNVMEEHEADCLIAIGGGSTMDAAKAAGVVYLESIDINHLLEHTDFTRGLPLIAIPTTSGSGSEVTAASIISDKTNGLKVPLIGAGLYPEVAIVDPELTLTCSSGITATSGIDVLCHALDCLGSVNSNPLSDALAVSAAKLAFENLTAAFHEPMNIEARENMSLASMMAGVAISQTGTSAAHALSYYLTSNYDVPHGEACAFTMDEWFVINADVDPRLNEHAKMIGFSDAEALSERFNGLKSEMGLAMTFKELGIGRADIETIAERSFEAPNMKNNIAQLSKEEVVQFLSGK
ncbi:iron-containing alcohol dehydrogenase family protein [Salinicoccus sp. Marseille-QA3877]